MALAKLLISFLYLHQVAAQDFFPSFSSPFGDTRLTAERGGPPPGAKFSPIEVVNFPDLKDFIANRPPSRPIVGRPPPPPLPPNRPRTPKFRPEAPRPLPIPVPVVQEIPQGRPPRPEKIPQRPPVLGGIIQGRPPIPENLTQRPPGLLVIPTTPIPEPEFVVTTPPTTATTNSVNALPAYYQKYILNEDGSYYFEFATPNGIRRMEQGFYKRDSEGTKILVKSGTYSYISPEGIPFTVDFVADENGYRASNRNPGGKEPFSFQIRETP